MKKRSLRLVRIAISAALYIALSLAIAPLSYGLIQVRFSEMLILLCFYDRDYCYSMVLGCAITNAVLPLGIIDVIFGTIGTILAVIMIRLTRRIYLAWIPPTICTFMVALEFYLVASEPFWLSYGTIALGEFIAVGVIGVPVFMLLSKNDKFLELIGADDRYIGIANSIKAKRDAKKKIHLDEITINQDEDVTSVDIPIDYIQPDNEGEIQEICGKTLDNTKTSSDELWDEFDKINMQSHSLDNKEDDQDK